MLKRVRQREYYNSHKEQCKGYVDYEKVKKAVNNYYKNHPEKVKASAKRWRENNHDKASLLWKRRDYRERNAEGDFTLEEWNTKLEEYNYRCAYCGCELTSDTITIDHQIPLIRGGTNYIDNLVPSCQSCNSKKGTKTAEEYLAIL
uniref:Putative homing endonuclease n=1 Tax=viral metagenome TaxID=1070528 RepID=A0A6M3JLV8_9ZZZZ